MSTHPRCAAGVVVLALGLCLAGCASDDRLGLLFPYQWGGELDGLRMLAEPSGIVFHGGRGTLFAVGDEGDVVEMRPDGTPLHMARILPGCDFEAITCDPATGRLYIGVEGDEKILEIDPDSFQVMRTFPIDRRFEDRLVLKPGGQGIEAMAFVPDPTHPEGGVFYVANQAFRLDDPEDGSAILALHVPLRSGADGDAARVTEYLPMDVIDLSALHFDPVSGHLLVVSDATNVLLVVDLSGRILRTWAFPGANQEGLAIDADEQMYVAQDSGGILRVRFRREGW